MADEDEKSIFLNISSCKRTFNRRVNKAVAKQTHLENLALVVNSRYNENNEDLNSKISDRNNIDPNRDPNFLQLHFEENNCEELQFCDVRCHNSNFEENNYEEEEHLQFAHENDASSRYSNSEENNEEEEHLQFAHENDTTSSSSNSEENNSDEEGEQLRFADQNEIGRHIVGILHEWIQEEGVLSMRKLDSLLKKLHSVFPNVPRSHKTLLQIPHEIEVNQVNGGNIWYKGITLNLDLMILEEYLQIYNEIVIDINIDGLPLFKSNSQRFWPILGKLVRSKNAPFIIAIFLGHQDPNMDDLLNKFVIEVADLSTNGYIRNDTSYKFSIRHYILDAPARSKVKRCIEHNGYCACEKCEVIGEYVDNRMTYIKLDENLRTDQSFYNQEQPYHHTGRSRLETIGAGVVSQFRLDSLHLVHLGVFKRLILAWKKWNGSWKSHHNAVENISQKLLMQKSSCPQDFNRPPRTLKDLAFFKATEFRRMLLYDGIFIFRNFVADEIYKHFLLLHCGIYILSSPSLVQIYCEYANQLLRTFISHSVTLYGQKFVTYNVHSLSHLASECKDHGKLENFSAFEFENKLNSIKTSLRSGYKPLQQAASRDLEKGRINITLESEENAVVLSWRRKQHIVNEVMDGIQFRKIHVNDIKFQCNKKDSGFKTYDNTVAVLQNIVQFMVFKFCNDGTEPDKREDILYDVGRTEWIITEIDDNIIAKIKWPLSKQSILVKKETKLNLNWPEYFIEIKRFYDTYTDAASACKKFIEDSNYETDKQLGRGMRKKRKPAHLDSESSEDSDYNNSNVASDSKIKGKEVKKRCYSNSSKKTSSKFWNSWKSSSSPPVLPFPERSVSPDKIIRQHKPIYSISVTKNFGKKYAAPKLIPQNNQKYEEKQKRVFKKLKHQKQNEQKDKHNSEKEPSCSTFVNTIFESPKKNVEVLSNSDLQTASKNTSIDKMESRSQDTFVVSPSVTDEIDIPPNCKLHTFSPAHRNFTSPSSCSNLSASVHGECQSISKTNDNFSITESDQVLNNNSENIHQVTEFLSLKNNIHKLFYTIKKELSLLNAKVDICLMNQEKLNRFLLPGEKIIKKPPNFPSLPVDTEVQLDDLDNFLKDDGNLSAACMYFAKYVDPGNLENSVRKILSKIMTNTLAQSFSFHGRGNKKKFAARKVWDLVQGALLQTFEGDCLTAVEKVVGSWLTNAKWRQQSISYGSLRQDC